MSIIFVVREGLFGAYFRIIVMDRRTQINLYYSYKHEFCGA
jgi:hypothetical protein